MLAFSCDYFLLWLYVFKSTNRVVVVLHVVDVILSLRKTFLALPAPPLHIPALWRTRLIFLLILLLLFLFSLLPFLLSLLFLPLLFLLSLSLSLPLAQLIWIVFSWFGFSGGVVGRSWDRRWGGGRSLCFDGQASMSSLRGNNERQLWSKAWVRQTGK